MSSRISSGVSRGGSSVNFVWTSSCVVSEMWTRNLIPVSSILTEPLTPLPHMSKWKRTVPMMPPVTFPVCTPMRTAMSIPSFSAFFFTTSCIARPIRTTRCAAAAK